MSCPQICELLRRYPTNRKEAVRVLTAFKLNVNVAVRELVKESLPSFIQVGQGEIQRMKEVRLEKLIKQKKDVENDVSSG